MNKSIFGLVLVLLAAGCTGFDGTQNASVNITKIVSTESQITLIPNPPLQTETDFTLTFQIKNNAKDRNIKVDTSVFDWGVCGKPEIVGTAETDKTKHKLTLVPLQTEFVEIKSKTPAKEAISNLKYSCPMQWRITYDFSSSSRAGFNILSKDKLTQLQRAGKPIELPEAQKSVGAGPIKINFDFKTDKNYATSNSPIQMTFSARDEGQGTFSKIEAGKFLLKLPKEWVDSLGASEKNTACTDTFEPKGGDSASEFYVNKKEIPLIQRSTPEIVCNLKAPDLDALKIPNKQYSVSAGLDYTYSIDGSYSVDINP